MKAYKYILGALLVAGGLSSCADMLQTDSDIVMYEKDNTLSHPTDSVYSVLGIISKMQVIADRTVLLGEIRGDLTTITDAASADLKRLSALDFSVENKYNSVSDYYAVINHCNYFIHHVDTTLERRGYKVFEAQYAAVKAFRAWTYLELAKAYGNVPLVLEPLMTELKAQEAMNGPRASLQEICEYFIADLTPYAYKEVPRFGNIYGFNSTEFFIPVRTLLGDLCLWANRYEEAARWYHDFLTDRDDPITPFSGRITWNNPTEFVSPGGAIFSTTDIRSFIPMETRAFDGVMTDLENIFCSTDENYNYYQVTPASGIYRLSAEQIYCMEYKRDTGTDTIYVPRTGFLKPSLVGDLRLYSNFSQRSSGVQNEYSEYSSETQTVVKPQLFALNGMIPTSRNTMTYLRYAEALNRAGYPQSAFLILKHGICRDNIVEYVDSIERSQAAALIEFDANIFPKDRAMGIHSRGSGDSHINEYYTLPMPTDSLATRQDTIDYQIPLVEDMIIDEMALEGAFEGYRYYDLMRVALRRNDVAYLAEPISMRNGEQDAAIRAKLNDMSNWYLPLP
jgi:hypothetical protein